MIDLRYEGSIARPIAISVGTWIATVAILYVGAALGDSSFRAIGVPPGI